MEGLALPFWVIVGHALILSHGLILAMTGLPVMSVATSAAVILAVVSVIYMRDRRKLGLLRQVPAGLGGEHS